MSLFHKASPAARNAAYPRSEYKPVIRKSICTGERTACMQHLKTGKLTELMLIRTEADYNAFRREYCIGEEDIETVY